MANPWLKKNPLMSMWLSAANSAAGSARGRIAAEAGRQSKAVVRQASNDIFNAWIGALTASRPKRRRGR